MLKNLRKVLCRAFGNVIKKVRRDKGSVREFDLKRAKRLSHGRH